MKTIGLTAVAFAGNKGANALLKSIVDHMSAQAEDIRFVLFSVYPEADRVQNPYPNVEVVNWKPKQLVFKAYPMAVLYRMFRNVGPIARRLLKNKILKKTMECDFIVDAAGVSFMDSRSPVANGYNYICMKVPLLLGRKVVKVAQAMGPFKKFLTKRLAMGVLPHMEKICARGDITYANLMELGLTNVVECADAVFGLKESPQAEQKVEEIKRADADFFSGKVISLAISSVVYKNCLKIKKDYVGIMAGFADMLIKRGYKVLILANAARAGKETLHNNDLPVCDMVYGRVQNKDGCRWYREEFDFEVIRGFIQSSHMMVGSRFHAMIGSLWCCVPVLLIGWSHKYKEILDMFHVDSFAMGYKDLSTERLEGDFLRLEEQYGEVKQRICGNLPAVKESAERNFSILAEELQKPHPNAVYYFNADYFTGGYLKAYTAFAKDEGMRENAASGGCVTALLCYLLEKGIVQGAFVSRQTIKDGKMETESFIAAAKEEVMDCQTSIYSWFPLEKDFDKLEQFDGKVAAVLLPCQMGYYEKLCEKRPELQGKIEIKIGLYCGGVADEELLYRVMAKNGIGLKEVERVFYRKGHWRGNMVIRYKNGDEKLISYNKNWSAYKNAFYYVKPKCLNCLDHFGYGADIAFGDVWTKEAKEKDIKENAVIVKSRKLLDIWDDMQKEHVVSAEEVPVQKILKGNKRSLIFKYYTYNARKEIGAKYGVQIAGESPFTPTRAHKKAARMILKNVLKSKDAAKMDNVLAGNKTVAFYKMAFLRLFLSK